MKLTIHKVHTRQDLELCADIWLAASVAGQAFVPPEFWKSRRQSMVDIYLPASEVFMGSVQGQEAGFYALSGTTLAALFILPEFWGKGVGGALLRRLQGNRQRIDLYVYKQNQRALRFYESKGFLPVRVQVCPHTGEAEILMVWKAQDISCGI